MAEERSEHRGSDGEQLHDTSDGDDGQRIDIPRGGDKHGGNVTSNAATLTVNAAAVAPTITTQPVNQTVTAGQTATFTVVAGGTAPLSYQWQKNGVNIAGSDGERVTRHQQRRQRTADRHSCGSDKHGGNVTSNAATLTVNAAVVAPTITTQPVNRR